MELNVEPLHVALPTYGRNRTVAPRPLALCVQLQSALTQLNTALPGRFPEVPEGGAIWVFAVK